MLLETTSGVVILQCEQYNNQEEIISDSDGVKGIHTILVYQNIL